jgi:CheY-like chemotaxis protein
LKNIGIILMTAYELPTSDQEAYLMTSGADRLLFKPLPPMNELYDIIREVIVGRDKTSTNAEKST